MVKKKPITKPKIKKDLTLIFSTVLLLIYGFFIWIYYPVFVADITLYFSLTSFALSIFLFIKYRNLEIVTILVIIGLAALFFYLNYLVYSEKSLIEFSFWNWNPNVNILSSELNLDFTKLCGDTSRGSLKMFLFINETINSTTSMDIPENINFFSIRLKHINGNLIFSLSNSTSKINETIILNGTLNKSDAYTLDMNFTLKENVKPISFISLRIYPTPNTKFERLYTTVKFNDLEYECSEDCILSSQPYKSIIPSNYRIVCLNFPLNLLNNLELRTQQTTLFTDNQDPSGKTNEVDSLWMHINTKNKSVKLWADLVLVLMTGLIVFLLTERVIQKRNPK